ncbi:MAG: hypothetical protein GX077_06455 [Tissierellia bacterium]|nr:hypothetical protein [Tissierellia bacterium]
MTFFLVIIGLFNLLAPRAAWYLEIGWKIKDSEPSDGAIIIHRVFGAILLAIGLLKFLLHR